MDYLTSLLVRLRDVTSNMRINHWLGFLPFILLGSFYRGARYPALLARVAFLPWPLPSFRFAELALDTSRCAASYLYLP